MQGEHPAQLVQAGRGHVVDAHQHVAGGKTVARRAAASLHLLHAHAIDATRARGRSHEGGAGKARIQGLELDLTAKPTSALTVSANYAYLDAKFQQIIDPLTGSDITNKFTFVEAPKHTLTLGAEYAFPTTPIG